MLSWGGLGLQYDAPPTRDISARDARSDDFQQITFAQLCSGAARLRGAFAALLYPAVTREAEQDSER
jgi:hypothetical protein